MREPRAEEIVEELNTELLSKFQNNLYDKLFGYLSDGDNQCILYGDEVLWKSEEDNRYFNELKNEYQDLEEFIKNQFNVIIENLQKLKF